MNQALINEIIRLGGDPSDEIWQWFVTGGPHGHAFSWGQTRNSPAGYVGVMHLQEITNELELSIPAFQERTLRVVNAAMASQFQNLVRRAIQVAAVVGSEAELLRVQELASSPDASVASDARASAFYLKHHR